MPTVITLFGLLPALDLDRQRPLLENTALRQQVIVLRCSVRRPKLSRQDRAF